MEFDSQTAPNSEIALNIPIIVISQRSDVRMIHHTKMN